MWGFLTWWPITKGHTQRVVIFSYHDMRDAPDHSPTLNIITHFHVTDSFFSALCPPLWHASRWMMVDCLVIKRWHFRGRSAGICTPHHLHSSNQRLHGKVHGCLVGAVIKKGLIKEGWRKSFHFFFHSHEITFVIWLHWMEGWVFYPFFPPRKTK